MINVEELARNSGAIVFEKIEAFRVSIRMHEPFRISSGEVSEKESLILKVSDGAAFGWGESSAMPGAFYSAETPATCRAELVGTLLPALVERTFEDMAALERFLVERTRSRFVRVAVETAAWELVARRRGVSLRALFGIPDRPAPSGLAVGLYDTDDELDSAIDRYQAREYRRLKIKIKRGHDVRLVRRVREKLGDFPLMVDANADYTSKDTAVFRELDAFGLMMFEQPLGKEDLEGARDLQRVVKTPICFDESIESVEDARRALALDSCRIVNIKLQRVGGYLEALRILNVCESKGVPVWMGTMPELGVGSAQALVLAAHASCVFPTDVEPSARWYEGDILAPELLLCNGHLNVPPGPGLGFTVDEAQLDNYTTERWTFPGGRA